MMLIEEIFIMIHVKFIPVYGFLKFQKELPLQVTWQKRSYAIVYLRSGDFSAGVKHLKSSNIQLEVEITGLCKVYSFLH